MKERIVIENEGDEIRVRVYDIADRIESDMVYSSAIYGPNYLDKLREHMVLLVDLYFSVG